MHTETATVIAPEAFAAAAVTATADLLAPAEQVRLRSSLIIDLTEGHGVDRAISFAMRSLESHRLGYRSWMRDSEVAAIAEVRAVLEAVSA